MSRRGVAPALAGIAAALTLAACGGSSGGGNAHAGTSAGTGGPAATQATVQAANCNVWSVLDEAQRRSLLEGMRAFFGARIDQPEGRGPTLTDDQAEALLQRFCKASYAGSFKLYKIYGRAAAFGG